LLGFWHGSKELILSLSCNQAAAIRLDCSQRGPTIAAFVQAIRFATPFAGLC
jgi:hypothetical protein